MENKKYLKKLCPKSIKCPENGNFTKENIHKYLPFLDKAAIPRALLKSPEDTIKKCNHSNIIKVKVSNLPPKSIVYYWAAEPKKSEKLVLKKKAYGKFSNSGVVRADNYGDAILKLKHRPQSYKVNWCNKQKSKMNFCEK